MILRQARTATAVNKQLNFTVKNKPQSNTFHHGEGCRRPEDVEIRIFPSSARRQPSLGVGKRYSRMTSKQSVQFFHTLLIIKYTSNMQCI